MQKGNPSHLRGAVRLAIAGLRRGSAARRVPPPEPSRKLAAEYSGIVVGESRLRRYLAATRAADLWDGSPLLPPTYSAVWETALTLELLAREGMPFPSGGIVHLGSELVVVRPLRRTDRVRCRVEVARIETRPGGTVLSLSCRSWNQSGQLAQENTTTLLVRGSGSSRRRSGRRGEPEASAHGERAMRAWKPLSNFEIAGDAGLAYARASGDFNPIHLWGWSSRLLGFARPILHGHCTLAMVAHEMLRCTGRSARRLLGSFRAPLELPQKVELQIAGVPEEGRVDFRMRAPDREGRPFVEGEWIGSEPAG